MANLICIGVYCSIWGCGVRFRALRRYPDGILDFSCSDCGCSVPRNAHDPETLLPAGYLIVNCKTLAAIGFGVVAYFALACYFKLSYVEEAPARADVAVIYRILPRTPGAFFAHMWLPNHVTEAVVYENGTSIGSANSVYDDPVRTFSSEGKRWKYVEFNTDGRHVRRWIIFAPLCLDNSAGERTGEIRESGRLSFWRSSSWVSCSGWRFSSCAKGR